jgi:hypothetical protein
VFLVNSRYRLFSATPFGSKSKFFHLMRAHLLPKLRCHFAEFLKQGSLTRLRILSSPTCVGLRYGHLANSLEAFLGSLGSTSLRDCSLHITSRRYKRLRICLEPPPTGLYRDFRHPDGLPFCVPPSLKRWLGGTGILTCFPSPTPFGLGLGTD